MRPMHLRRIHTKICLTCSVEFKAVYKKNMYCSRQCVTNSLRDSGRDKITFELLVEANNFKSIDEKVAYVMNVAGVGHSTVYNKMSELNYEWTKEHTSRAATKHVRKRLRIGCALCSEIRVLELAHILPACDGGSAVDSNLLSLCPTHHKLFDTGKLNQEESEDLEYILAERFPLRGAYAS